MSDQTTLTTNWYSTLAENSVELKKNYFELKNEFPTVVEDGFKSFFKYVYMDEFDVQLDQALDVLTMAKFYKISALVEKCVFLLKSSVCENNVVELYQAGTKLEEKELYDAALAYIFRNSEKIIHSTAFLKLSEENLCFLLQRDELNIDEITLYKAVCRWGTEKCKSQTLDETPENLRRVLMKPLKHIRFPLFKLDQLTIHVAPKQLLTDTELLELYKYSSLTPLQRTSLQPTISFPTGKRVIRCKPTVYKINRFERIEAGTWTCENKIWSVDFKVNRPISIHGYGFLGPLENFNAVYDTEIHLVGPKVSMVRKAMIRTTKLKEPFYSEFIEPIRIVAGVWYTAAFKFVGPPTMKVSGQLEHVSLHCGDVGRVNFTFRIGKENSASHQLYQILFSF